MKLIQITIALLLIIFISPSIYSQEENTTRIGISSLIQESQVDILLPIKMDRFSIAPSVAFIWGEDVGSEIRIGIAPRVYFSSGKAVPFIGIKANFLIYSPKEGDSVTDYLLSLTGGGEYFLDTHFSLGVEAQLNFAVSDKRSVRFGNPGKTNINTGTAIFATYYF